MECAIDTEVGSVCVDCAGPAARRAKRVSSGRLAHTQFAGAPATLTFVVVNLAVFVIVKIWSPAYQYLAMSPGIGYFQPWRLITAGFVHIGFFHILFNMLMLYVLGSAVERALGTWRFVSVYLLSALAGSMAVIAWVFAVPTTWNQGVIGASGALYGLFGAVFVVQRRSGMSTQSILILLGINLAYGFIVPGISWQAHIGGFVGGILATTAYWKVAEASRGKPRSQVLAWNAAVTAALVVLYAGGTWALYAGLIHRFVG